jgi:hypothetical protein
MVAAEDDSIFGESATLGHGPNEIPEIGRLHSCVAAELIDLVHSGFDE